MVLADAVALFVDVADLDREHEPHFAGAGGGQPGLGPAGEVGAQAVEPGLGRLELLADLGQPARVSEVTGADQREPLLERRPVQRGEAQLAAGRAGEAGVDVKVGEQGHSRILLLPPGSPEQPARPAIPARGRSAAAG